MTCRKVLVLLSSYNGEKYIYDQIVSILSQKTIHNIDLLIRDDGSTDSTIKIIKKLQEKYCNNIKLIIGENIGYNKSFFELIKIAEGYDYYALSDQDDVWLDNKIEVAINRLDKEDTNKPLLYASSSYLVYDDLIPYGKTQLEKREITLFNTIIQNFFPGHEQVLNNYLLDELKMNIDIENIYVHDSWITNVAIVKGRIIFNNEPYVLYRQHKKNAVGYGKGKYGWIKERIKRIRNNDGEKYFKQITYFCEVYKSDISLQELKELQKFIKSNKNFIKRFIYIINSKLYRQSHIQTCLFKILYLVGGYK